MNMLLFYGDFWQFFWAVAFFLDLVKLDTFFLSLTIFLWTLLIGFSYGNKSMFDDGHKQGYDKAHTTWYNIARDMESECDKAKARLNDVIKRYEDGYRAGHIKGQEDMLNKWKQSHAYLQAVSKQ